MHPHLHYLRCHLLFEACSRFRISLKGTSNILASTHATKSNLRKISKTILPSDYTLCFWTFPAWKNELRSGCSLHPPTQLHQFTRIIWYDSFLICANPCSLWSSTLALCFCDTSIYFYAISPQEYIYVVKSYIISDTYR